jgi:hypothetical protein
LKLLNIFELIENCTVHLAGPSHQPHNGPYPYRAPLQSSPTCALPLFHQGRRPPAASTISARCRPPGASPSSSHTPPIELQWIGPPPSLSPHGTTHTRHPYSMTPHRFKNRRAPLSPIFFHSYSFSPLTGLRSKPHRLLSAPVKKFAIDGARVEATTATTALSVSSLHGSHPLPLRFQGASTSPPSPGASGALHRLHQRPLLPWNAVALPSSAASPPPAPSVSTRPIPLVRWTTRVAIILIKRRNSTHLATGELLCPAQLWAHRPRWADRPPLRLVVGRVNRARVAFRRTGRARPRQPPGRRPWAKGWPCTVPNFLIFIFLSRFPEKSSTILKCIKME